jgi:hypothetical protein
VPQAKEARTLAIALLASLVLWNLPFGGVVLYPFKVLATWLHEMSHGLAMLATGAGLDRVLIYRDTSGLAYAHTTAGGGAFGASLIATAGYMGTPLWGAALLVSTPDARRARVALLVYAALLAVSLVVVDNGFGQQAVGAIAVALAACAMALPARARVAVAHFVAAQACIDALLDIRVLFRTSQVINGHELACTETVKTGCSDAHNMASYTFGTTADWAVWTWAAIWLAWSLLVLFVALRWQARRARGAGGQRGQRADASKAVKNSGAARASDAGA